MKSFGFLLGLVVVASCHSYHNLVDEEWETFKAKHDKIYESKTEEEFRFKIYLENKYKIAKHNQEYYDGKHSFDLEMNKFGDMLSQEIAALKKGFKPPPKTRVGGATYIAPNIDSPLPNSIDWVSKGAVTAVKNQGNCGSCWAFSAIGSLEGQQFRKTGKLVDLSVQELVDCDRYMNDGCKGGMMENTYENIKDYDTEESYPYKAVEQPCQFKNSTVAAHVTGYVFIPGEDEDALQKALAYTGPVAVAIDAGHDSFTYYKSGVYFEPRCETRLLDHAVLVVGYGTTDKGEDYWLVKNSWSAGWGMKGYIMMARNKHNMCGISTHALYPLV